MFALQRQQKIRDMLLMDKKVDVSRLSKIFSVSEVTIRRDLDKLDNEGLITKTYGGAFLKEEYIENPSIEAAPAEGDVNISSIAEIASEMIEDGDAIYLSPGEICKNIAMRIKRKRIAVVTNDIAIAYELYSQPNIKTIIIGGEMLSCSTTVTGVYHDNMLSNINIGKAFINITGADLKSGFTVNSYDEARIIQKVVNVSREVTVVATSSQFDKIAFANLFKLDSVDKIITNFDVPNEYKTYFFDNSIEMFTKFRFD